MKNALGKNYIDFIKVIEAQETVRVAKTPKAMTKKLTKQDIL
jgi:hypothetical protein